jgi:hypothetical protein
MTNDKPRIRTRPGASNLQLIVRTGGQYFAGIMLQPNFSTRANDLGLVPRAVARKTFAEDL